MSTPCCAACQFGLRACRSRGHELLLRRLVLPTESSTLLSAVSSASTFSFLRCSSAKVRWAAPPLAALAVVGPEGTVGAWRLFILSGRPIAVGSEKSSLDAAFSHDGGVWGEKLRRARARGIQSTAMTRSS